MPWRSDRSTLLLAVACITLATWLGMTVAGLHPDGAILGFSGTMWMLWGTAERDERKRRERADRTQDDDSRDPPSSTTEGG